MTVYASVKITLKNSNTYDHVKLFCTQEWNNERMKIKSDQTAMIFETNNSLLCIYLVKNEVIIVKKKITVWGRNMLFKNPFFFLQSPRFQHHSPLENSLVPDPLKNKFCFTCMYLKSLTSIPRIEAMSFKLKRSKWSVFCELPDIKFL